MKNALLIVMCFGVVSCHEGEHDTLAAAKKTWTAEEIKEKINSNTWHASDLVDYHHMKEELKDLFQLKEKGDISMFELSAYLFRIHDFDGNQYLDGLEVSTIMRHMSDGNFTEDDVANAVDNTMKMDVNNDGYIDYAEMAKSLEKEKAERKPEVETTTVTVEQAPAQL